MYCLFKRKELIKQLKTQTSFTSFDKTMADIQRNAPFSFTLQCKLLCTSDSQHKSILFSLLTVN